MDQSPGTRSVRAVRCHAERGNEEEGAVAGLAGLTPREIEVLILLARGATHRECAARLGLKPKTLDNHKTRLMRDLGLHRQIELVRFAEYHGLIDGPPPGSDPAEELEYVL